MHLSDLYIRLLRKKIPHGKMKKKQIAERKKRMRREQSVYMVFVLSAAFYIRNV